MTNWEYQIVAVATPDSVTLLNEYGRQGWEAVGITNSTSGEGSVLLKRALAQGRVGGGRM